VRSWFTLDVVVLTGWIAIALIVLAAALPTMHRLRARKRAAPASALMRTHAVFGIAVSAIAFLHTIFVLPSLGAPAAIAGGFSALAAGALAFFLLMAHTGIGLQLRRERLKDRAKKRRTHLATAIAIALAAAAHVVALRR
jgi:hypothetical protein